MTRPGVTVTEAPLPRVVSNPNPTASYGGFLGTALRGPSTPVLVTSWSDFVAQFGGFASDKTLPDAVYQFFNNGGGNCYVARVLAATGTQTATLDLGDPVRLRFNAISAGLWGDTLSVAIDINGLDDSLFTLTVKEEIRGVDVVVERFRDLTMDTTSPRYVENIVNSPTIGSKFIVIEDVVADDSNLALNPEDQVGDLAGGADGGTPVSADYEAVLTGFDGLDANFVFNAPGVADVSALEAQISGVDGRQDSLLVVDTAENQTPDMSGASLPTSSYSAVYYPWVWIADPSPDAPRGAIKKVPPGASVVGMILRTDAGRGVWKAPAGVTSTLTGVVANEQRLTNAELDTLAGTNVNVVRPVPGSGIAVMGARTRGGGTTAQYISVRRTLNYIKKRAVEASRFAIFEPNGPALWDQLRVANGAFLSELWQSGGLAGNEFAEAFYVKCDAENNTPTTIGNGEVHIEIGVAPVFPAEFIVIKIGQFEADASVVVSEED